MLFAIVFKPVNGVLGSVGSDGTYSYVTLTSTNASTTSAIGIRGGAGTLGSLIISSTTPYAISIYDGKATTTVAGDATLIATIPASTAVGTYTFDVSVIRGITVGSVIGFAGSYVIT